MMIFGFFRKIYNGIINVINSYVRRLDKKSNNARGYLYGSPKGMRLKVLLFIGIIGVGFISTVLLKRGTVIPMSSFFEKETAPGAKIPVSLSRGLRPQDMLFDDRDKNKVDKPVDCDRLLTILKTRGSFSDPDREDFEKYCKKFLTSEMQELVDTVLNSNLEPDVAAEILKQADDKNAKEFTRLLRDDKFKEALKTDGGKSVARNISTFASLSPDESRKALDIIASTPAQFREDAISAVKSIAKLNSPEARDQMLTTLSKARSKDDINQLREFADTISTGDESEQLVFAKAFDKAPDSATRAELNRAAKEILAIDAADPVRRKLVTIVEQIADLPPERQKEAYARTAQVANVYRTTDDPALKAALADAIMKATSPDDIIAIGESLDLLAVADKLGGISSEDKIAVVTGRDPELIERLKAAQVLLVEGDVELAKKAKDGQISRGQTQDILERSSALKELNLPSDSKASVGALKSAEETKRTLLAEKENLEREITDLLATGISPGDASIVSKYRRIGEIDDELKKIDLVINAIKDRLREYLKKIKERTVNDFNAAGVSVPDFDIGIDLETVIENGPDERLSNLQQYQEFWGSDQYGMKKNKHSVYKFTSNSGSEGPSILAKISDDKNGEEWYVSTYGAGTVGALSGTREFEVSKTMVIPGILRRIPDTGIPSNDSQNYTIYFEFLVSVANRKTGKIEIPAGSLAICKPKSVEQESSRMMGDCDTVDIGGREDIRVNFALGDATGSDGIPGMIVDNRGWQLAGIFLTAFSAAVLEGYSQSVVAPFEQRATKTAGDYVTIGAASGSSKILEDVAAKQIESWTKASVWWKSYDGALATVRQK